MRGVQGSRRESHGVGRWRGRSCREPPDAVARVNAAISAAVDKAGYGAEPRAAAGEGAQSATQGGVSAAKAAREAANKKAAEAEMVMRRRLIVSFVFTIPLFYLSMGHMFSWPLPACFLGHENMITFAFTQFLLLIPVIAVNFKYFSGGFKSLVHGSPNMDSLIALGATASTVYGIALALEWERATSTRRIWP